MIALIILLVIVLFLIFILTHSEPKQSKYARNIHNINNIDENYYKNINTEKIKEISLTATSSIEYKKYYRPKRYVITINELNFYNVLSEVVQDLNLVVFSQVSLYNIIETRPELDFKTKTTYFNKISAKTIDFVLVDKKDCRIKLCIELDDSTHRQEKRIKRDCFINELFKSLEIDLLRYPVYKTYYKDTLKKRIQENIKEHYYID